MVEIEFIYPFQYVPAKHIPIDAQVVINVSALGLKVDEIGSEDFSYNVMANFGEEFITQIRKTPVLLEIFHQYDAEAAPIYSTPLGSMAKEDIPINLTLYLANSLSVNWQLFS